MALFTWYNKNTVNNEELDEHHKALFDIFNKLYSICFEKKNYKCIGPIVEELISYSHYHFSAEETHMVRIGFKELDRHIIEHMQFGLRTLQLQQVAENNEHEATKELIISLGVWLLNHVIIEDKKYSVEF